MAEYGFVRSAIRANMITLHNLVYLNLFPWLYTKCLQYRNCFELFPWSCHVLRCCKPYLPDIGLHYTIGLGSFARSCHLFLHYRIGFIFTIYWYRPQWHVIVLAAKVVSKTGRRRFRRVRFQAPNSVHFVALIEFWGQSSVSSFRPIICVWTHRVWQRIQLSLPLPK